MQTFELKTQEGRDVQLAMQELWITGEVLPIGARLVARHVFVSAEPDPVEVVYSFMLPRDAALRQFRIEGEGFSVHSELQSIEQAEETYEQAMDDGYLASMTRNYRDGVTNLIVGNLQPGKRVTLYLEIIAGVEARDDGYRFRFPFTLAPSYHPRACTVLTDAGEGEMELPRDTFGDVILPPYRAVATDLHRVGFDLSVKAPGGAASVSSPSHTLDVDVTDPDALGVRLSREADVPNRDLVLDVNLKESKPLIYTGATDGSKTALAAYIPSTAFGEIVKQPSRTVFVIDRSGSMGGPTMEQAKKSLRACLGALSKDDTFNIVAFDNRADVMAQGMVRGDRHGRKQAETFLDQVDARGGTELQQAVFAAADLVQETGGDLFLITDGQVFETETILERVSSLGLRVHVLGIGSASQDRFLTQLARETGGTSRFVTPRERVDRAAMELFGAISSPVAVEVTAEIGGDGGTVNPAVQRTVFAGSPVILYGEADRINAIELAWSRDGAREQMQLAEIPDCPDLAGTLRLIRGARLITDLESRAEIPRRRRATHRDNRRVDNRLERLSVEYGLASRAMALVAVVESEQDESGKLAKTRVVPVGMPEDVAMEAYFGRAGMASGATSFACQTQGLRPAPIRHAILSDGSSRMQGIELKCIGTPHYSTGDAALSAPEDSEDRLIDLAAQLEPDGGMPGENERQRVMFSLFALLCFVASGNTEQQGTYRRHVERLAGFLRSAKTWRGLPDTPEEVVTALLNQGGGWPDADRWAQRLVDRRGRVTVRDFAKVYGNLVGGEK